MQTQNILKVNKQIMLIFYTYMWFCTSRVMSAPLRKSRRIAARLPQTNDSINPNIPVHTTYV